MAIYENGMAPITENVGYEKSDVGKSFHNLSRVHQCQGIIGAEMPIDVIKTIPDDTFTDLEYYVNIVSRNPLSRDLRNGITVALHAYWSPCSELWEGWNNYITKGRSGKESLTVPRLFPYFKTKKEGNEWNTTLVPCSPADYMGVPIAQYDNTIQNKNYVFKAEKVDETKEVIDKKVFELDRAHYITAKEVIEDCLEKIDEWYKKITDKNRERVCLIHNNLSLEHYIKNENEYLISWDNYTYDNPVIDLYKFYQNDWSGYDNFKENKLVVLYDGVIVSDN